MDRKNFFFKQFVSDVEFNSAYSAVEDAIWNQCKDRGAFGIISGYVPTAPGAWNISFSAGKGIDKNGARLSTTGVLTQSILTATDGSATAPTAGNRRWISIFARAGQGTGVGQGRNLTDSRINGLGSTVMFSAAEALNANDTPAQLNKLLIVKGAEDLIGNPYAARPALDASAILLADVLLTAGDASLVLGRIDTWRAERFYQKIGWTTPDAGEFRGPDTPYVLLMDAPMNDIARSRIYASYEGLFMTSNASWNPMTERWIADDTTGTATGVRFGVLGVDIFKRTDTSVPWTADANTTPTGVGGAGWDGNIRLICPSAGSLLDLSSDTDTKSQATQTVYWTWGGLVASAAASSSAPFPKTFPGVPSSVTLSTAGMAADTLVGGTATISVPNWKANGALVSVVPAGGTTYVRAERNVIATY